MGLFIKPAFSSAMLVSMAIAGSAQAEPDHVFAVTVFLGGGGSWHSPYRNCAGNDCDVEIPTVFGGGDIVLPLSGYWNLQIGAAMHWEQWRDSERHDTIHLLGGAIGFWRDPAIGVFGIEAGAFRPFGQEGDGRFDSVKVGGVAQYYFSDMITIDGFGGIIIPLAYTGDGAPLKNGFYTGGNVTYYATDNLAFAGFARYIELPRPQAEETTLRVGGKIRYLTMMPGVEVYASGGYVRCVDEIRNNSGGVVNGRDGVEITAGIEIRLGGITDNLMNIDRSNPLDTRAWNCTEAAGFWQ